MADPLEIGLVAPLPPQVGGVASFAQWLIEHESEIGCRYRTFDLRRPPESEEGGRLRIATILRQGPLVLAFARWLREAPTLVHYSVSMSATGLPRDLLFVGLLRTVGRHVIAHVHGPTGEPDRLSALKRVLLRAIGRLSAARIAVVPLEGWTFVPNPLRLDPERRRNHRARGPVRILAVGLLGRRKGSDLLIDALAAARARGVVANLRFVGRELRQNDELALRTRVRERGLADAVEFAGTLPPVRLVTEYQRADVFCLPSRREGLPMALVEAMAFELPVVTTPVGAIPALVEDGLTGLVVEPENVDRLAEALERLATDEDLRARLGAAASERVQEMCASSTIAAHWRQLYTKLAR